METKERAKKIIRELGYGYANTLSPDDRHGLGWVISQLDEAVREASNAKFDNVAKEYYRLGFAAAREKAAGIADIGKNDSADCCWVAEVADNRLKEIDRLKAEMEALQESGNLVLKDRDLWKSKAEKLAEALRKIAEYKFNDPGALAKSALAEFGEGK